MKRVYHRHRPAREEGDWGFLSCVAPYPNACNPGAHGGVVWLQICQCGAVRRAAGNGGAREYGPWE